MVKKQSNCNKVKGKKWGLKILSFGLLGVMLASTSLFGLGHTTTQAQTAQGGSPLADGGARSSPFGLNPETDPVIYTTESGLDIKFGGATVESGALHGYTYFTMGKYNNIDVNWVIIGRNSQTNSGQATWGASAFVSLAEFFNTTNHSLSTIVKNWLDSHYEDITPFGSAIVADDLTKDYIYMDNSGFYITLSSKEATSSTIDKELNPGEILCFCEYVLGTATSTYTYTGTNLQKVIDSLPTTLGFDDKVYYSIIPKSLYVRWLDVGGKYNTYSDLKLFPLSNEVATQESFNIFNYLPEAENRIGYDIETGNAAPYYSISGRAGSARDWGATTIGATGGWGQLRPNASCGVRPAFVMKLV